MNAIRIQRILESDTVPELKPLIGRTVEIIVLESADSSVSESAPRSRARVKLKPPPAGMAPCKSVKQLAAEQGVTLRPVEEMLGGWPLEELNDDFESALREWRRQDLELETERQARMSR